MIKKLLFTLLAIFGFTFLLSGDTFADSPSYTISEAPSSSIYLCSNSNPQISVLSIRCSDYLYVNAEITGSAVVRLRMWSTIDNSYNIRPDIMETFSVKISSSVNTIEIVNSGYDFSGGGSVTFSFSDIPIGSAGSVVPSGSLNITENGTYDVTNYASAVVNIPTETIISDLPPYSELVVDSFWKYHVAIAGGLASIFAIFVVYRIIKSRLR